MRIRKILVMGLLFGTVGIFNAACTGDDDDDDDGAITITPANPTVTVGSDLQLTATVDGTDVTLLCNWTSNSAANATVGATTGIVMGVSTGSAVITATLDADHDASVTVTVEP